MYAAYHLKADELNADIVQTLKNTFHQREIVILSKETYEEWEKELHNAAFTEKLRGRIKALDEGRGVIKTMAELKAMANE
jgi:PHD/YefM family antitoxin component YafN of YafNO toxin-antitoxin module